MAYQDIKPGDQECLTTQVFSSILNPKAKEMIISSFGRNLDFMEQLKIYLNENYSPSLKQSNTKSITEKDETGEGSSFSMKSFLRISKSPGVLFNTTSK